MREASFTSVIGRWELVNVEESVGKDQRWRCSTWQMMMENERRSREVP